METMKRKKVIFTVGILVWFLFLGCLLNVSISELNWRKIETGSYRNIGFEKWLMLEDEYSAEALEISYKRKFDKAVSMLKNAGVEDIGKHLIVVDISEQKEYVYEGNGELARTYKISMKKKFLFNSPDADDEIEERLGGNVVEDVPDALTIWKVVAKVDSNLIPLYGERLLRMHRRSEGEWINSGIALHGTSTPEILGTPESLGCVYHSNVDIIALYDLIDIGTYVVVIE